MNGQKPTEMKKISPYNLVNIALILFLLTGCSTLHAQQFSTKSIPTVNRSITDNMDIRYYTELLGVSSAKGIERQFGPLRNTDITTIVCCPMAWRFYNFPSAVDLTWKEPNKFPRDTELYPAWNNMVKNLQNGGDPLQDAIVYTRQLGKRFIVSIRMNDNHYISNPNFPTHNNFWREHPEYKLGNSETASVSDSSALFNYMIPEVRDFYFHIIEELCTKYDIDGIELDFQRAPKFFTKKDLSEGRLVMTAHVERIREMMDRIGKQRNRKLELGVRVLQTVKANYNVGLDILDWDRAGLIDGITVSPYYIHTNDVGIEEFVEKRKRAKVYGELNYINFEKPGLGGHDNENRRFLSIETYRSSILSFLERGADGVSFFNTYTLPARQLSELSTGLLANLKDITKLKQSNKDYTTYANTRTMFGKIFPAVNEATYQIFIADDIPGNFKNAVIRFETDQPSNRNQIEAWINGIKLKEYQSPSTELFASTMANNASAKKENLRFFTIPLSILKYGSNQVRVKNTSKDMACTFISSELGLYLK